MGEDQLLKLLNLVLQNHEIGDGLVAFIRVIYCFQTDILFILKSAVELGMLLMERQLSEKVVYVFVDERTVAANAIAGNSPIETIDPASVRQCFPQCRRMSLLENLVDRDQGLERLNLIGENRLAAVVVSFTFLECVAFESERLPYTLMPDQKA